MFWINLVLAIFLPMLTYMGINFESVTSWAMLWEIFLSSVKNPVITISVIVSVWNLINDPTTPGISDSERALSYISPGVKANE